VQELPGAARFHFVEGDCGDAVLIGEACKRYNVTACIHFAAFANLRESLSSPDWVLRYYANNTAQAIGLLEGIEAAGGVQAFVFSSTCCTYGDVPANQMPIVEETTTDGAAGAYGKSKLAMEFLMRDYFNSCKRAGRSFGMSTLRYFNVAGCSRDGVLGEARDKQLRIIPILMEAALGKRESVSIFGTDFPTRDGTAIRDYIHVEDLARAHVMALEKMVAGESSLFNLGIGKGFTIRELIKATERVVGCKLNVTEAARNPGEAAAVWCDPAKANSELGWQAEVTEIDEIVRSVYNFMYLHPNGYKPVTKSEVNAKARDLPAAKKARIERLEVLQERHV